MDKIKQVNVDTRATDTVAHSGFFDFGQVLEPVSNHLLSKTYFR